MLRFRWSAPEGSSPRQEKQLCFSSNIFQKQLLMQMPYPASVPIHTPAPISGISILCPQRNKSQPGIRQAIASPLFPCFLLPGITTINSIKTGQTVPLASVLFLSFVMFSPKGHEVSVCLQLFQSEQLPPPRIQPAKDLLSSSTPHFNLFLLTLYSYSL